MDLNIVLRKQKQKHLDYRSNEVKIAKLVTKVNLYSILKLKNPADIGLYLMDGKHELGYYI